MLRHALERSGNALDYHNRRENTNDFAIDPWNGTRNYNRELLWYILIHIRGSSGKIHHRFLHFWLNNLLIFYSKKMYQKNWCALIEQPSPRRLGTVAKTKDQVRSNRTCFVVMEIFQKVTVSYRKQEKNSGTHTCNDQDCVVFSLELKKLRLSSLPRKHKTTKKKTLPCSNGTLILETVWQNSRRGCRNTAKIKSAMFQLKCTSLDLNIK